MTARGPALSSHTLMDPTATGRHPRVRTRQSIHHVVNGLALIDRVGLLASDSDRQLDALIAGLPRRQREVIELYYFVDLPDGGCGGRRSDHPWLRERARGNDRRPAIARGIGDHPLSFGELPLD